MFYFTAPKLRDFAQRQSKHYSSTGGTKKLFTAVRMFLRYLTIEGKCPAGLVYALPPLASWSQQSVPSSLPAGDVERLIAACDPTDKVGMRDRAILLLLARLGLRAGDVAGLRLADISWPQATIRVIGKDKGRLCSLCPKRSGMPSSPTLSSAALASDPTPFSARLCFFPAVCLREPSLFDCSPCVPPQWH